MNAVAPLPDLKPLYPFQHEGVRYLQSRDRAMLLYEQGLGKTVVALRAAGLSGLKKILVLCPAIGRVMWSRAFEEWSVIDHERLILSYDYFSRGNKLPESKWDLIILDEGHYLKSTQSKRTRAIYGALADGSGVVKSANVVWLLSGTLTPNGVHEIYPHLRALYPETVSHWLGRPALEWEWLQRYVHYRDDMRTNRRIIRGPKLDKLGELKSLVHPLALRRLKRDVLPDLPPIRFDHVPLLIDESYRKDLARLESQYDRARALMTAIEDDGTSSSQINSLASSLTAMRKLLGRAKAEPAAEYVANRLIGGNPKIVVFCYHREVVESLVKELKAFNPVYIYGGVADKHKADAISRFQNDPTVRVFIGNIQACGTTITLTAASDVVFVESSYVPGENAQAWDRCHRIGTTRGVFVTFLSVADSLDDRISSLLCRKAANITKLWSTTEART